MNRVTLPNTPFQSVFNRINAKNGAPEEPSSEFPRCKGKETGGEVNVTLTHLCFYFPESL